MPSKTPPYSSVGLEDDFDDDDDDADYVRKGVRQHQVEMARQDEDLDALHGAVQRLGDMSLHISSELDSQNALLEDLNEETDKTTEALNHITKKTREMIKQSGGVKYFCTIIVLTLVMIFLAYLIIMT